MHTIHTVVDVDTAGPTRPHTARQSGSERPLSLGLDACERTARAPLDSGTRTFAASGPLSMCAWLRQVEGAQAGPALSPPCAISSGFALDRSARLSRRLLLWSYCKPGTAGSRAVQKQEKRGGSAFGPRPARPSQGARGGSRQSSCCSSSLVLQSTTSLSRHCRDVEREKRAKQLKEKQLKERAFHLPLLLPAFACCVHGQEHARLDCTSFVRAEAVPSLQH